MLTGPKLGAASGKTDALVIFVHGYGADGQDLLGLGNALAPHLPHVAFHAPNAPDRCRNNPMGYQWFPVPWLDGSSEEEAMRDMAVSAKLFDAYIDAAIEAEGVTPARTVLVGFSQGTMMSLHVAPRRAEALGGIVGFSGRLLLPEQLGEVRSKPPILLVHGDADDVVPPASLGEAETALRGAGFEVSAHMSPGTAHGIAPDGLGLALGFLRAHL